MTGSNPLLIAPSGAPAPLGNYARGVRWGGIYMLSGQLPLCDGRMVLPGRLGENRSIEEGQIAARQAAINVLAQIAYLLGNLDRLERLLRLDGLVACAPQFHDIATVIDAASDLFVEMLGQRGEHARSAAGVMNLPGGASVELIVSFVAQSEGD